MRQEVVELEEMINSRLHLSVLSFDSMDRQKSLTFSRGWCNDRGSPRKEREREEIDYSELKTLLCYVRVHHCSETEMPSSGSAVVVKSERERETGRIGVRTPEDERTRLEVHVDVHVNAEVMWIRAVEEEGGVDDKRIDETWFRLSTHSFPYLHATFSRPLVHSPPLFHTKCTCHFIRQSAVLSTCFSILIHEAHRTSPSWRDWDRFSGGRSFVDCSIEEKDRQRKEKRDR